MESFQVCCVVVGFVSKIGSRPCHPHEDIVDNSRDSGCRTMLACDVLLETRSAIFDDDTAQFDTAPFQDITKLCRQRQDRE